MKNTINFVLKVIVIGEPATGKTSLVKKFVSGHFSQDYRLDSQRFSGLNRDVDLHASAIDFQQVQLQR